MYKSSFFTGQPIFSQILKFIPRQSIVSIGKRHNADRYCKKFSTYDHLVTLLYSVLNDCTSIREITTGMMAWENKLLHLGLKNSPRRSTLSDANSRRDAKVFEDIYFALFEKYARFLSDSRSKPDSRLYIFDSTNITLFQEVLRALGLLPKSGRQKGGIKVHTLIRSDQDVPCFIKFSAAVANDSQFLKEVEVPKGSIILFDRGYFDYTTFNKLTDNKVTWITRKRSTASIELIADRPVPIEDRIQGVLTDQEVIVGYKTAKARVRARLVKFRDATTGKMFQFLSNSFRMSAITIAQLYKQRWQIETLFKRLKQNYPLKYFLGDTENAVKIQIWCTLIADLLIKVIKKQAAKKWSFSNLVSMIRVHMMTYIDLYAFLRAPERALLKSFRRNEQSILQMSFGP